MKQAYDHVALSFTMDTESVNGILDGDYKLWTFTSESPAFRHYIPSGVLKSSAAWKTPIPKEVHMLYKFIWTAAESKGYTFDGH
jgi:hypothetical protein